MSFLSLVQDLHRETGAAGIVPTTVVGASGELARLVGWIKEADRHVQNLYHDWLFLRTPLTSGNTTTVGDPTLAKPLDLAHWDPESFLLQPSGEDGFPIEVVEWQSVRGEFFDTAADSYGQPDRVIIMPDNSLKFDPVPDAVYTLIADYYRKPTVLAGDDGESAIPDQYQFGVIVGRAMVLYGNHENAPEMKQQGAELYEEAFQRLMSSQLPSTRFNPGYRSSGNQIQVVAEEF